MTAPERPEKRRRPGPPPAPAPAAIIPDDLLFSEVLPRLPVKSLVRFKSVCRAWRDAIHSTDVARRHLELSSRATPPAMLVIPREDYHYDRMEKSTELCFYLLFLGGDHARAAASPAAANVELVFEKVWPGGVTHEVAPAHCDGLVAVATNTGEVFVCNPATREFVALPLGTPSVRAVGGVGAPKVALGYDASRGAYVVARYFYRKYKATRSEASTSGDLLEYYSIGHEVFTLGDGGGGWEATDDPPHPIAAAAMPICTREAIYWCTEHLAQNALMRFDLRSRAFDAGVVPIPPGTNTCYAVDHVTEPAGKLCYADIASDTAFDVWVADDGGGGRRPEWTLRCRVDLGEITLGAEAFLPVAVVGDEMLVAVDYKKLYGYDERAKSVRLVVDMAEELVYERQDGSAYFEDDDWDLLKHHVVPYVQSVVSIRGRQWSKVC